MTHSRWVNSCRCFGWACSFHLQGPLKMKAISSSETPIFTSRHGVTCQKILISTSLAEPQILHVTDKLSHCCYRRHYYSEYSRHTYLCLEQLQSSGSFYIFPALGSDISMDSQKNAMCLIGNNQWCW